MINVAADSQADRLEEVSSARSISISENVVVVDFSNLGPNSTYYRVWLDRQPVLVAFIGGPSGYGTCSFVVRNFATAEALYGSEGLLPHYGNLDPPGCGGREIIGGSHRTRKVNWDTAIELGRQLDSFIRK